MCICEEVRFEKAMQIFAGVIPRIDQVKQRQRRVRTPYSEYSE